ncbi:MAG: FAD-binding oxidoreductase [Pirellula sp.]|jgi:glycine/D-amino acid oxidase-like deaminating enzyme|nr:FAD-binding oxidoreductase [Pirellula sp.]
MKSVDLLIVGCGLAGSAIAWQAHRRGMSIAIADRNELQSCSMVAAGLVTPITGSRAAASWEWHLFFSEASHFYPWIEEKLHGRFWYSEPAIRIFLSEMERIQFEQKWFSKTSLSPTTPTAAPIETTSLSGIHAPWGGCSMSPAARLDTHAYLSKTREFFKNRTEYHECDVDCDSIVDNGSRVQLSSIGISADAVILCQGVESRKNQWFAELPLHPARGDILTLEKPRQVEVERVVHHNVWVVPTIDGKLKIGATYNRHTLDGIVDNRPEVLSWKSELIRRWEGVFEGNIQSSVVLDHQAAVRPASYDRHPLIGRHIASSRVFCLNGLGSKGTLMAPALARIVLSTILNGDALPPQLDWQRPLRRIKKT